ncbi:MAG: acyltransferase [Rhodoferax sp.]|uniref:acyltransferase n=1 Tax=Rhodoferax sp. TaxID=50421 RepID=UPI00261A08F0|nr:acyltransferase [Rhodoferax sp.]MDD5334864.1 acyltransferase [Rhodoferax sp.]
MRYFPSILVRLFNTISNIYWIIIYSNFRKKYEIDESFRFNGKLIQLYGEGSIRTGVDSYIGALSTLQAAKGYAIDIGSFCSISHNVRVYTQSASPDYDFSIKDRPQKCGDVTFGDYCWVGANVFINPGVAIGNNSVVGANSVVTKDIPPFEIWGGVPAKLIRKKRAIE